MSNWADATRAAELAGAIDPPVILRCEACGEDLEDGQTGLCDECLKKQAEFDVHQTDPRRA